MSWWVGPVAIVLSILSAICADGVWRSGAALTASAFLVAVLAIFAAQWWLEIFFVRHSEKKAAEPATSDVEDEISRRHTYERAEKLTRLDRTLEYVAERKRAREGRQ